ncbi:hypothetical protein SARC_03953 [Sphaeroforma arctica JP610]|uniref:Alpha-1,4-N-acetylglucosaminyltransferase n=1 Tax=Sphaeroforma arctica JP610 TaxID=667725 RepID=A0A0L0G3U2_9EUKA|nr:hypothetical protein SARC_03953 [Sphaeroforma arctica JP610]KNC83777.1 hypothetical protein SARC_03953 [Sphaeroforma arctica JP610]|eukprot:XP_014157679.1 hypothetical protein SARC_03953 [Sphaeroforma arctica JP610]
MSRNTVNQVGTPPILHMCWMTQQDVDLPYYAFLSISLAQFFLKPEVTYLYVQKIPKGPYFEAIRSTVSLQTVDFNQINGISVDIPAHAADIVRFLAVYKYGGVYLDVDFLLLRSLPDHLKTGTLTAIEESQHAVYNGFLFSAPRSQVILDVLDNYSSNYDGSCWACNSVRQLRGSATKFASEIVLLPSVMGTKYDGYSGIHWGEANHTYDGTHTLGIHLSNSQRRLKTACKDCQRDKITPERLLTRRNEVLSSAMIQFCSQHYSTIQEMDSFSIGALCKSMSVAGLLQTLPKQPTQVTTSTRNMIVLTKNNQSATTSFLFT